MATLTLPECFLDNVHPIMSFCREHSLSVDTWLEDGAFDGVEELDPAQRDDLFHGLGVLNATAELNSRSRFQLLIDAGVFERELEAWSATYAKRAASDGWGLFTVDREPGTEIQRDDDSDVFGCDDEAALHVGSRAVAGDEMERRALWVLFHVAPCEYYRAEALYRLAYNRGLNVIVGVFDAFDHIDDLPVWAVGAMHIGA